MSQVLRVALPGYNALTDTDPDHFALYSDEDWILIKEKTRGSISVSNSSEQTIAHGLNYVPLVFVFIEITSGVYQRVDGNSIDDSFYFTVDDTNLYIGNYTGSSKNFIYHIFYDGLTSGSPSITESSMVLKVARPGKSANSTNPNDYIFHSDLNTFKIIKNEVKQITLLADTLNQSFTEAHGLSFIPLVNAFAMEVGTNRVFTQNSEDIYFYAPKGGLWSTYVRFNYCRSNSTNLIFNFDNRDYEEHTININYFCLEKI